MVVPRIVSENSVVLHKENAATAELPQRTVEIVPPARRGTADKLISGDAPAFGIPFGARHISVHVELPDNFPVRHEPYRRFVQLTGSDQRQVMVEDFAELVFRNRPDWVIEIINSLAPKASASTDDLRKELQDLLNELRIQTKSPRETETGIHLVEEGGARGARPEHKDGTGGESSKPPVSPTDLIFNPAGAKRANISKNLEQAPEIIPLRNEEDGVTR